MGLLSHARKSNDNIRVFYFLIPLLTTITLHCFLCANINPFVLAKWSNFFKIYINNKNYLIYFLVELIDINRIIRKSEENDISQRKKLEKERIKRKVDDSRVMKKCEL